jgi:hypothetical protein
VTNGCSDPCELFAVTVLTTSLIPEACYQPRKVRRDVMRSRSWLACLEGLEEAGVLGRLVARDWSSLPHIPADPKLEEVGLM